MLCRGASDDGLYSDYIDGNHRQTYTFTRLYAAYTAVVMERRTILKAGGGIAAVGTIGGLGLLATTGGASATAGSQIDDPSAVTSDDGEISHVAIQTTGRVEWDGFDTAAKNARIISRVKYKRDGNVFENYTVHDTGKFSLTGSWGGSGEETHLAGDHEDGQSGYIASDVDWGIAQTNRQNDYNNGYGLPSNPAPTSPLYATSDGESVETRVIVESEYRLYDSSGSELTGQNGYPDRPEATEDFVVTVNNEESSTSFGRSDAEGDSTDDASVGV